jgi:hypothetical protein
MQVKEWVIRRRMSGQAIYVQQAIVVGPTTSDPVGYIVVQNQKRG